MSSLNRFFQMFRRTLPLLGAVLFSTCDSVDPLPPDAPACFESLTSTDLDGIFGQAIAQALNLGASATLAIVDREGNNLGVFRMTGAADDVGESIRKARTAAYLSSNQHGFTTLTAAFITRQHFPPGISNTPAGPLFGVPFSSLPGGDVQPNPGPLSGTPGGVPIFKNGCLVGGVGVTGGTSAFVLNTCTGTSQAEATALGAVADFMVPDSKRGDVIFLDGIRLLYANTSTPPRLAPVADPAAHGAFLTSTPSPLPTPVLPNEGFIIPPTGGIALTATEVSDIIERARLQANKTRAAIRRPLGSPARVFIAVVDVNGAILGLFRTFDATIFSMDVAVQKARTVVAFSDPSHPFGQNLRAILGLGQSQALAITSRAVGFLSQDFFPPGIDRDSLGNPVQPGPLFGLQETIGLQPFGNGITIFPGGIPLYKNGVLAGGIGISGDGVDQDDMIAFAGSLGFAPPESIRSDQFSYRGVRLPFVKFPRHPELN